MHVLKPPEPVVSRFTINHCSRLEISKLIAIVGLRRAWLFRTFEFARPVVIRGEITFGWIDTKIFEDLNLR